MYPCLHGLSLSGNNVSLYSKFKGIPSEANKCDIYLIFDYGLNALSFIKQILIQVYQVNSSYDSHVKEQAYEECCVLYPGYIAENENVSCTFLKDRITYILEEPIM